jgi:chemotaxis signal transduction protein
VAANKQEEEEEEEEVVVLGRTEIMEQPMGFVVQGIAGITTKALQQFGMNSNSSN